MTEVELQSELMSYADRFASIITQALEDFETLKPSPQARQVILSDLVYSISSIYTIAAEPNPQVGMLDMVAVTTLGRMIYEDNMRRKYGQATVVITKGFRQLEKDIWRIAAKVLTKGQQGELRQLVLYWRKNNPEEERATGLVTELRKTIEGGNNLLLTANTLTEKFNVGETSAEPKDSEPFDIKEYQDTIAQVTTLVEITNQLVGTVGLEKLLPELVKAIDQVGNEGEEIIEVQQVEEAGKSQSYFIISEDVPEDLRPRLGELRQLLGLSNRNRFRITDRVTNLKDDEISIQTRSVMAMMEFVARGVEVPLEHLREGRVIDYGLQDSDGEVAKGLIPFRMRSSKDRPQNVFAAVRFNDYWYYIDHADITTKRALSLIIVLFRLQAPPPAGAAPNFDAANGVIPESCMKINENMKASD